MSEPIPPTPLPTPDALELAQCASSAKLLQKLLPPEQQISRAELEVMEEERRGRPLDYGSPVATAAALQERIKALRAEKAQALDTMDDCPEHLFKDLTADCRKLDAQIAEAQQRLDAALAQGWAPGQQTDCN